MTRVRAVLGCLLVLASVIGFVPHAGAAPDQDVATCVASGQMTNTPLQPLPGPMTFTGYLLLDCVTVGTGDDGGTWYLPFAGSSSTQSCAAGTGSGSVVNGATSEFDGDVWAGSFTYVHAGLTVTVSGTVYTDGDDGRAHRLAAELALVPSSPSCPTGGGSSSLTGSATIVDGVVLPPLTAGAAACAASGVEHYPSWLDSNLAPRPVVMEIVLDCTGLPSGGWALLVDGIAPFSVCAAEQGSGSVVSSATPIGSVSGSVVWSRVGAVMLIEGSVSSGSGSATFIGQMLWAPTAPPCLGPVPFAQFTGPAAMVLT